MPDRRSVLIGVALACGYAVVLGGPALLLWNVLRPEPWNERSVKVRFESVRYEAGGLVFTYTVENQTGRSARFSPEVSKLRVLQPSDAPQAGYPSVMLPLEIAGRGTRRVDIRLDLPSSGGAPPFTAATPPPGWLRGLPAARGDAPLPRNAGPPPEPPEPRVSAADRLRDIDGFELTEKRDGLRIVFPRAW